MARDPGLAGVKTRVSGIVGAPVSNVWGMLRCFGQITQWLSERSSDGMSLHAQLMVRYGNMKAACTLILLGLLSALHRVCMPATSAAGFSWQTSLLVLLQPGALEGQVGARRLVVVGGQRYIEELEGLDDRSQTLCGVKPTDALQVLSVAVHSSRLLAETEPAHFCCLHLALKHSQTFSFVSE